MMERKRQELIAFGNSAFSVYRYHYLCDDGTTFSAIASTESGAFRVLNAEIPGMIARFVDKTPVPCNERIQEYARFQLTKRG